MDPQNAHTELVASQFLVKWSYERHLAHLLFPIKNWWTFRMPLGVIRFSGYSGDSKVILYVVDVSAPRRMQLIILVSGLSSLRHIFKLSQVSLCNLYRTASALACASDITQAH